MKEARIFEGSDRVVDLIESDYNVLTVLSRFSLPLGFGDKSIAELCEENGIDTDAFILVVNFLLSGYLDTRLMERVRPWEVVDFLHNSHDYYLSYKIPHLRANLEGALDGAHADINPIILRFFDDYVALARRHFAYEEETVFPYVRALAGGKPGGYTIDVFRRQHDDAMERKLAELKTIILRYYTTSMPHKMYDVLVDIFNCEDDLNSHAEIENRILVPMITALEGSGR